jgi:hypothetical protein
VRTVLQRLLVLAAAVALLGHGGVELGPRLAAAGAGVAAASSSTTWLGRMPMRPAVVSPPAVSQPAPGAATLRQAWAVAAGPGASGDPVVGPGSAPLPAPHLVARPAASPPESLTPGGAAGWVSERAPPVAAGT